VKLDLSHNNLRDVSSGLRFYNLEILSLYGNKLDSTPNFILASRKLRKLDLGFNRIKTINSSIAKLSNLEFFSIPNNEVAAMSEEMGMLSKLEFLYMPGNRLETMPVSMSKLPLKEVDVEFNKLKIVPPCIFGMSRLEGLYASDNLIESLPRAFVDLRNLKVLHIDSNKIEIDGVEAASILRELRERGVELKY
jgi:Leucine-rich repeat (LRR) protein